MVWRRGYTVISTGHILLSRDTRLSVGHTGHLHIAAVRHNDTGISSIVRYVSSIFIMFVRGVRVPGDQYDGGGA